MSFLKIPSLETVLKKTVSRCPVCHNDCPAEVVKAPRKGGERIIMRRRCPVHGTADFTIATDTRFHWLAKGDPSNASCGSGCACPSDAGGKKAYLGANMLDVSRKGLFEKLSTCLALIEVVDSCNLECPTCFAASPKGVRGVKLKYHSFDNVAKRIQGVIDRKGRIEIVQFSGGEPTIHPEFYRLVDWVCSNPQIDNLLVNTNGVRFATDQAFLEGMKHLYQKFGCNKINLYMQFDGMQEVGQTELRGLDLRKMRERAIHNCARIDLPVTLAMVVSESNLAHVWDTLSYLKRFEHIRGVSYQPMFLSGRVPQRYAGPALPEPITAADIINGIHNQSGGLIRPEDFTSLPCGDPNCLIIGWQMRMRGEFFSPSRYGIDIPELQRKLPDRMSYSIDDLRKCGCENTALGNLMKKMELKESHAVRIVIKPFMDDRTWDQDRIDRCCTHVIRPDGELDSFCRYYGSKPTVAQ